MDGHQRQRCKGRDKLTRELIVKVPANCRDQVTAGQSLCYVPCSDQLSFQCPFNVFSNSEIFSLSIKLVNYFFKLI